MSESVDWDFIFEHHKLLSEMISKMLDFYSSEFELATKMNEQLKTYIIDKSIIYTAAIASGQNGVKNFEECVKSKFIKDITPFIIPADARTSIEESIDDEILLRFAEEKVKLFLVDPIKHLGRKELLYKCVIFQLKLIHKQHEAKLKDVLPAGLKYASFEDIVKNEYADIVNRSIQFILCYEANHEDFAMCRKILLESAKNSENYHYRLEKHVDIEFRKQIDNFLKNYLGKKIDFDVFVINNKIEEILGIIRKSKKIDKKLKETLMEKIEEFEGIDVGLKKSIMKILEAVKYKDDDRKLLANYIKALKKDEFKEALFRTIEFAKKAVEEIFHFDEYKKCQKCSEVQQVYFYLFQNFKDRVTDSAKLINFKMALQKAKLNYVSKHQGQYIYPFLYDLIVMTFSFSIKRELYKLHIEKTNILAKSVLDRKYSYIDVDSVENYLFEDLLQLIDMLPDEFKEVDPALLIIKHYSEILEVDYEKISTVLRQIRFLNADDNKPIYNFPKPLKNLKLSIDDDYFRALSLEVI